MLQAREAAKSLPKYSALAWLDGIWCGKGDPPSQPSYKSRWDFVGSNEIRKVDYTFTPFFANLTTISKNTYTITVLGDLFEIRRGYTDKSGTHTTILKYKKESDTQISRLEDANFKNIKKTSEYDAKTYFNCRG